MNNDSLKDVSVTYEILDFDKTNGNVTIKIYCNKFKNDSEAYPQYRFNIADFDTNKDIQNQMSKRCFEFAQRMLAQELSEEYSFIQEFIEENKNIKIATFAETDSSITTSDTSILSSSSVFDVIN